MAQPTPLWLGDLLAAVVIATAVYCGARIVYAKVRDRATHDDVDGLHVLMGVAMAGMLTAHLADLTPVRGTVHAAWVAVFALCTAWFGYRVLALRRRGRAAEHGGGPLVHLVGSAAMLYMLAVATSGGAMAGAAMSAGSGGAARLPELGILLAVLTAGAAVLILDRITVTATVSAAVAGAGVPATAPSPPEPAARRFLAPRAAEGCHLAMCVIMAYMLIAMFA
jgi:hypothetical protein